jgi:hypothetical protein
MPRRRVWIPLIAAVLVLVTASVASRMTTAQQVGTVQPGTAAIWTDQSQYQIGSPIQVCYRIPMQGQIQITDLPADGTSQLFFSGQSAGTSSCLPGTVTPPAGTECMRLTYPQLGGTGQTQTCFQVVGPNPPPPPSRLSISTNRSSYNIGDPIQVCYQVPAPGPVTITDILANGTQQTFFSGYDDGTGGCLPGTVTPPAGTECLRIQFGGGGGQIPGPIIGPSIAQTCFQVRGPLPPPPAGWVSVGSARVDSNGNWNFDGQAELNPSFTYMRVTSGSCDDNPASTLVWEAALQRDNLPRLGVDVFDGDLFAVGLAVSSGGHGHARISRPVTLNPVTQVDATLFQVGIVYTGTNLTVCMRAP